MFEKENLGWWLQQLQQRFGEWWELQQSKLLKTALPALPDIKPPTNWDIWLNNSLIFIFSGLIFWLLWRFRHVFLDSWSKLQNLQLPSEAKPMAYSVADWVQRSRRYYDSGDYYQACRCLYFAMLQQLHENGLIPHQTSRTDEEYRLLILELPEPDPYERLLMIHQELCFGKRQASAQLVVDCQAAFKQISA
ncbi:MAG: DUF4129 domain-containing protein [Snowella sp.]|nr:DUF4129 domain-containing protein [Snowella sp.]